jgi:hypothetical protein
MTTVQFTVAEIKLPPAGKERGNVITTEGRKYGLFREKASLLQLNCTYEAEVTDGQYCNIVSVKLLSATSPQPQQAASAPSMNGTGNGNGHYRPTDPADAKRIFVCANLTAMIRAGKVENTKESLWATTQILCQVYDHTFGNNTFRASDAGKPRLVAAE